MMLTPEQSIACQNEIGNLKIIITKTYAILFRIFLISFEWLIFWFFGVLGSDIMMQLDDVVSSVCDSQERFEEATARSVRWLDRCIAAHKRPNEQNLFAIIQGGLDVSPGGMRERCLQEMIKRDLPGTSSFDRSFSMIVFSWNALQIMIH